jgi:threonyl-tRNA synthetase
MSEIDQLLPVRHSAEHVLTMAMEKLYGADEQGEPVIIKAMGPPIKDGFYFDFDIADSARAKGLRISENDFPKIEKEMKKIIGRGLLMERVEVSIKVARQVFARNPYKQELLDGLEKLEDFELSESVSDGSSQVKQQMLEKKPSQVTFYLTGDAAMIAADKQLLAGLELMSDKEQARVKLASFVDLCKGPHIAKISEIKAFKLLSIAGAYWRGNEKNKMLTRIYGTAFTSQAELDDYLAKKQMAEERNHRKIGKEMELFTIIPEIGQGLPIWLPNGYAMRRVLEDYMLKMEKRFGYVHILTPHLNRKELFETSGDLGFYDESMYPSLTYEEKDDSGKVIGSDEVYYPKPMNCPAGMMVYRLKPHSYRDLPIKMGELGTVYRREKSGELHGLQRVRGFTQNDAHIFCTPEQLKDQFREVMQMLDIFYADMGFDNYHFRLSLSDPDKEKFQACGKRSDWDKAENILREILNEAGVKYVEAKGEAAFYGPKLDVQAVNVFGKEDSISTIQVDFNLPERFDLTYVDEKGEKQRPFVIHRALVGSFERFFSFLIEHHGGDFPVWLAPVQVKVLPIADRHEAYAREVFEALLDQGVRVELDDRSERLQAKIRQAEVARVPIMLIIGDEEVDSKQVGVRVRGRARERVESLIKQQEISAELRKSGDLVKQTLAFLDQLLKK